MRELYDQLRTHALFFFQAEDGIRDYKVTGVQTCALPICVHVGGVGTDNLRHAGAGRLVGGRGAVDRNHRGGGHQVGGLELVVEGGDVGVEIGRASCRERV